MLQLFQFDSQYMKFQVYFNFLNREIAILQIQLLNGEIAILSFSC